MELTRIYKLIPYLLIILALGAIACFILTGQTAVLIKSPILILLAFIIIGSIFIILTKKHHSESVNIDKIACLNLPQRTLRRIFVITAALMMVITILGFKGSVIYIVLLVILFYLDYSSLFLSRDIWRILEKIKSSKYFTCSKAL